MLFDTKIGRIAFALTMWTTTVLLALRFFGLFEDDGAKVLTMRQSLCEIVAVDCSQFASLQKPERIETTLEALLRRHPEVLSAACKRVDGEPLVVVGPHERLWQSDEDKRSVSNCILVPVMKESQKWGQVEVCFRPLIAPGLSGILNLPSVRVVLATGFLNLIGFWIWLQRCVRPMDPSAIVPQRVRDTLDTMAEAVLILDTKQRIVTANESFGNVLKRPLAEVVGKELESLDWLDGGFSSESLSGQADGQRVRLRVDDTTYTFLAKSSEVRDERGVNYGTLLSLADITPLENSRAEIERKNKELEYLATRDPLTNCLNRRSFFEIFKHHWQQSVKNNTSIGCVMVDIDHFKSINDTHGHAVGDEVLRDVSAALLDSVRGSDCVCRYGGEEFCVLMIGVELEKMEIAANRYRTRIESLEFPKLSTSASLGCSIRSDSTNTLEEMLEQADKALYAAKRSGRNRVVCFNEGIKQAASEAVSS